MKARQLVHKGQSLIEAIAAIALVILVVTALVGLAVGALQTASVSRNRSHAVAYAQEGMEKVRASRDQNDWATFTSGCQSPPGLPSLPPPFDRLVTCTGSGNTRRITVRVSWTDALGNQSVDLDTYLTNWR